MTINSMRTLKAFFLTLTVYGFIGWLYIVISATFHPKTLSLPLTHLASWPREDTFGIVCFFISIVSFFIYNLIKDEA